MEGKVNLAYDVEAATHQRAEDTPVPDINGEVSFILLYVYCSAQDKINSIINLV